MKRDVDHNDNALKIPPMSLFHIMLLCLRLGSSNW